MTFANSGQLAVFANDESLDSDRGALLLEQASAIMRNHCRQTLDYVEDDAVELRGTARRRLLLPERPVVSVSAVSLDGYELVEGDDFNRVRDGLWRDKGWGGQNKLVTVTYTHGFVEGSAALQTLEAVCLQVAFRLSVNPAAVSQETLGDLNRSFPAGVLSASEQAILERFRHDHASAR
jgi:hypothetical protein